MKTKLSVFASAMLLSAPVLAQEPPANPSTEPSTTQVAPQPSPAPTPAPAEKIEPAPTAPAPSTDAAAAPAPGGNVVISELRETSDDNKMVGPLNATVDKVEDMNVYDANGKKIAEVEAILEDKNGDIKGVAIEYGGFLGFGEKGAVMTLDQVKEKDGNLVTEVTEDQLPNLPAWTRN